MNNTESSMKKGVDSKVHHYKYTCNVCSFYTNYKSVNTKHFMSERHKLKSSNETTVYLYQCTKCNKSYKTSCGLWKHKPKCTATEPILVNNQQHTNIILESVAELKTMMEDIKSNQKPTTINNNINFILNEKFNNAKNFIEMINDIQMSTTYPLKISSANYVDMMVGLLKTELDKLPPQERPIHCIKNEDENQKIIHIRHENEWHKETELDWTSQIHNYYLNDGDEPTESEKKIIFKALQNMEEHLMNRINELHGADTKREYGYETNHPPNKVRIIKYMLEYINMEREELIRIVEETYKHLQKI